VSQLLSGRLDLIFVGGKRQPQGQASARIVGACDGKTLKRRSGVFPIGRFEETQHRKDRAIPDY
jgi:hypothetical protein